MVITIIITTMIKSFRALEDRYLNRLHHIIITIIIVLAIALTVTIILAFQDRDDPFMKHQRGERIITTFINNFLPLINNLLITITITITITLIKTLILMIIPVI